MTLSKNNWPNAHWQVSCQRVRLRACPAYPNPERARLSRRFGNATPVAGSTALLRVRCVLRWMALGWKDEETLANGGNGKGQATWNWRCPRCLPWAARLCGGDAVRRMADGLEDEKVIYFIPATHDYSTQNYNLAQLWRMAWWFAPIDDHAQLNTQKVSRANLVHLQ